MTRLNNGACLSGVDRSRNPLTGTSLSIALLLVKWHPKAAHETLGRMVLDPCRPFDLLAPIAAVQRVVHDECVGSILRGEWRHPCDGTLREQKPREPQLMICPLP